MSDDKFECEVMSWDGFQSLAEETARKIAESGYETDFMVGLARGGWVLSRVLCDYLGVKVEHWGVTATPDGKARIKYPFDVDLTGRRVLVVDDITDTGESMIVAMDYVKPLNPLEVRTASLLHINSSGFTPDYYGDEISWRWVIFPWNYVEDMCNIVQKMEERGVSASEIKERLRSDHKIEVDQGEVKRIRDEIKRRKG